MSRLENKQRWVLAIGGILLTLLLAAIFTFGSLDVPFEPKSWRAVLVLYAVSSFITGVPGVCAYFGAHDLAPLGRTKPRAIGRSLQDQDGLWSYGDLAPPHPLYVCRELFAD